MREEGSGVFSGAGGQRDYVRCGVSGAFVGHLERAEKIPSVETLMRLCIGMDMSMDYLVMGVRRECERTRCALYEELRELLDRYTRNKSGMTKMTK